MAATIAVLSSSDLFAKAHQLAKATRDRFDSYRDAFAAALREGHKAVKKMQQIVADKLRSIVRLPRIVMRRENNIVNNLLSIGCKIWQGKRIYANFHAARIFSNYDQYGRGRQGQLQRAYYDLTDGQWHDNWIGKLNPEFAA